MKRNGMPLNKYQPYTKEQAKQLLKAIELDDDLKLNEKLQCKRIVKLNTV